MTIKRQIPAINSDLVHTIVSHMPAITNMGRAFEKLEPLEHKISKDGWAPLRTDFLLHQGPYSWKGEQNAQGIEEADLAASIKRLAKSLSLKKIFIGETLAYNPEKNSLLLSPEGAVAAAIMQHYMGKEISLAAPLIKSIIKGSAEYSMFKEPRTAAAAYFFLHIASHGIDGTLCDLRISQTYSAELHSKSVYLPKNFYLELNLIHLNFLESLMRGDGATFYEYLNSSPNPSFKS